MLFASMSLADKIHYPFRASIKLKEPDSLRAGFIQAMRE
jgi:hypothetical protein